MATENLYAETPELEETNITLANIYGNTISTWDGYLNVNESWSARVTMENPSSGTLDGTQTVNVRCRKGSQSRDPEISVDLYESGSLVQNLVATTAVTSTTGQDVSGNFNASALSAASGNDVEIRVVITGAGGPAQQRNSVEVAQIEWVANTVIAPSSAAKYYDGDWAQDATILYYDGGWNAIADVKIYNSGW